METILNFIKEALKGKMMSAQWIVTLAIAIAGVLGAGMLAMQEYESIQGDIKSLKAKSHDAIEPYDDAPLNARVTENAGAIIRLQEQVQNLNKDVERTENTITNNNNPLAL